MKNKLLLAVGSMALLTACDASKGNEMAWFDHAVKTSGHQLLYMAEQLKNEPDTACFPRSIKEGKYRLEHPTDWTSGFYPGSMWLAYELTGDEALAKEARKYTDRLQDMQYYTGNHDLGFMMFCSYGQGIRLKPEPTDSLILIHSSESLCSRFRPEVGLIRSWDFGDWSYPVIIDNMMNLEMLFWASEQTNNPKYREIAISHADKTLKNHFREDMTSYHVVSYLADSGEVESKGTFQGYADSSAWARGQAWGVYGYTMCYRFTKQQSYLDAAHKIARFIIDQHPFNRGQFRDITNHDFIRTPYLANDIRNRQTPLFSQRLLFRSRHNTRVDVKLKRSSRFIVPLYSDQSPAYSHLGSSNTDTRVRRIVYCRQHPLLQYLKKFRPDLPGSQFYGLLT